MKMTFKGLRRSVFKHEHQVHPTKNEYVPSFSKTAIRWRSPMRAEGVIRELELTGNFSVVFDFEELELKNWATQFARGEPKAAIRLFSEMLAEAQIALIENQKVDEKS
jgi:hypothetical protein